VANLSRELDRFGAKLGKIRAVGILLAEGTNRLIGPEVQPHSTARTPHSQGVPKSVCMWD
jgi:hypothetical protein